MRSHLSARQTFTRLRAPSKVMHKISHDYCFAPMKAKRWISP
jgi:hypothetical protein